MESFYLLAGRRCPTKTTLALSGTLYQSEFHFTSLTQNYFSVIPLLLQEGHLTLLSDFRPFLWFLVLSDRPL